MLRGIHSPTAAEQAIRGYRGAGFARPPVASPSGEGAQATQGELDLWCYIRFMYEVLAFVYENCWGGDAYPGREQLGRKLSTAGFEREDILEALAWLDGLHVAALGILAPQDKARDAANAKDDQPPAWPASPDSLRVYTAHEMAHLGSECIACIRFLEDAGALPPELREVVIDRALAIPDSPLDPDDLKIIVLMVYWRVGAEPDVLILDELCDDVAGRWKN